MELCRALPISREPSFYFTPRICRSHQYNISKDLAIWNCLGELKDEMEMSRILAPNSEFEWWWVCTLHIRLFLVKSVFFEEIWYVLFWEGEGGVLVFGFSLPDPDHREIHLWLETSVNYQRILSGQRVIITRNDASYINRSCLSLLISPAFYILDTYFQLHENDKIVRLMRERLWWLVRGRKKARAPIREFKLELTLY